MTNTIHPTAVITGDVTLGAGNTIGPFVTITGPVTIGDGNWIGAGVVIGAPPEVRSYEHPRDEADAAGNGVVIGDNNVIREYAQVHQGWKGQTALGSDLFIMNQVYIAHDCTIADTVTMASSVLLAGHVTVGAGANLGLGTSVHQFTRIGGGTMVGMGSVVTRNIPPFAKAFGNPAKVQGINRIGMERGGIPAEDIEAIASVYSSAERDFSALAERDALRAHFADWV